MNNNTLKEYEKICKKIYKKDEETKNHCINMMNLILDFSNYTNMSEETTLILLKAACFHDVGKNSLPKEILFAKRQLNEKEMNIVKNHVTYETIFSYISTFDLEQSVIDCILQHHENINGTGYPKGLKEFQINPLAQVIAIIDTFEALQAKRCYKKPLSLEDTKKILIQYENVKFDKNLLEKFIKFINYKYCNK